MAGGSGSQLNQVGSHHCRTVSGGQTESFVDGPYRSALFHGGHDYLVDLLIRRMFLCSSASRKRRNAQFFRKVGALD